MRTTALAVDAGSISSFSDLNLFQLMVTFNQGADNQGPDNQGPDNQIAEVSRTQRAINVNLCHKLSAEHTCLKENNEILKHDLMLISINRSIFTMRSICCKFS